MTHQNMINTCSVCCRLSGYVWAGLGEVSATLILNSLPLVFSLFYILMSPVEGRNKCLRIAKLHPTVFSCQTSIELRRISG